MQLVHINDIISHETLISIFKTFIKENSISMYVCTLVILFRQTEIVLKDSTAFVYVTQSEKSSH